MAILLAMYQKMRLIREKNQAILDQTRFSSKLSRVQKNIERVQKMYTSRMSKLESDAKRMQNSASIFFRQMSGLGMNQVNINYNQFNGMTAFVMNNMKGSMISGQMPLYKDGKKVDGETYSCTSEHFDEMMNLYTTYGDSFMYKRENGEIQYEDPSTKTKPIRLEQFTPEDINAFNMAKQSAMNAQSQAQMTLSTTTQNYENNVSIWLEAAKEQLEAEQDAALEPLNYQETMWELEKNNADMRLKRINADLEAYDQLVSEETKNSAPSFGLR